jgi:hypothetical protein
MFIGYKGDAWTLARSPDGVVYIQHESDIPEITPLTMSGAAKGFDFSLAQPSAQFPSFSTIQGYKIKLICIIV